MDPKRNPHWRARKPQSAIAIAGLHPDRAGNFIYLHTAFWGFALWGLGTPAPIAPPNKLGVEGLHRYVRNPMYIGVLLMVLGQAVLFRSMTLLRYAAGIWLAAHLFVLLYEEPALD